jgi:hypothetical protein
MRTDKHHWISFSPIQPWKSRLAERSNDEPLKQPLSRTLDGIQSFVIDYSENIINSKQIVFILQDICTQTQTLSYWYQESATTKKTNASIALVARLAFFVHSRQWHVDIVFQSPRSCTLSSQFK